MASTDMRYVGYMHYAGVKEVTHHPGFYQKHVRIRCTDSLLIVKSWLILLSDFTGLLATFSKTMLDVFS